MEKTTVEIIYHTTEGERIRVETTTPAKDLFEQADRQIRRQRRQERLYLDFAELDECLESSLTPAHKDIADLLKGKERDALLHEAISTLTEVERRRLRMYCLDGLTCKQIAKFENESAITVLSSVMQVLSHLRKVCNQ